MVISSQPTCRQCQRLTAVLDYLDKEWEKEEPDPAKQWFQVAKVDCSKNERLATVGFYYSFSQNMTVQIVTLFELTGV